MVLVPISSGQIKGFIYIIVTKYCHWQKIMLKLKYVKLKVQILMRTGEHRNFLYPLYQKVLL